MKRKHLYIVKDESNIEENIRQEVLIDQFRLTINIIQN